MRAWLLRVPEARRLLMTFQPAPISGQSDSSPAKALGAASHAMAPKNGNFSVLPAPLTRARSAR